MVVSNLLDCYPNQRPKAGLEHTAQQLEQAGVSAGDATQAEVQGFQANFDNIANQIKQKINGVAGGLKGPAINAREQVAANLQFAINNHYRVDRDAVQDALAYFCLSLVTEGFEGGDTTGTQMGNFQGSWPGGGFK